MDKSTQERMIVIMPRELLSAIEDERRLAPGAVPARAEIVRELIRDALQARATRRLGEAAKASA